MPLPTLAREFMTTKLVTLSPEMDVFAAIDLLVKNRISGVPVIMSSISFWGYFLRNAAWRFWLTLRMNSFPAQNYLPS